MDLHERRFLTSDDRNYLEEIELSLTRVHGLSSEQSARAVRALARVLHHRRMQSNPDVASSIFPYGGATAHAEVVAALLVAPRAPSRFSLALLALLAAVAGLLGIRTVLGLVFRRIEPVRIGALDVLLAFSVVGVVLIGGRSPWLMQRLGKGNWFIVALGLGFILGIGGTIALRRLHVQGTFLTLPFWLAAALAALCAALTWLLTWPDDQRVTPGGE